MSRRIHVWLLQPGPPSTPDELGALLTAQATGSRCLPWWLVWLGPLGVWLWVRWWTPRLLIGGPPSDPEEGEAQARALGRLLGESWNTLSVHSAGAVSGSGPGVHEAAAHLSRGDAVALVELCPLGGLAARSLLNGALLELSARGAHALPLPPLHQLPAWREAVAETLRAAVADLPRNTVYEVLFCVSGVSDNGEEGRASREAVADIVLRTPLARPHHLAFLPVSGPPGSPGLQPALDALRQSAPPSVVVVLLNPGGSLDGSTITEALRAALPAAVVHVAPALHPRASFNRALCDWLREAATASEVGATRPAKSA